jgi:hypothetical protein
MMFTLLCVGIVVMLCTAITFMAFVRARDGYEDDSGFHLSPLNPEPGLPGKIERSPTPLPPLATAGL